MIASSRLNRGGALNSARHLALLAILGGVSSTCSTPLDDLAMLRAALVTPEVPIRFAAGDPEDLSREVSPRALRLVVRRLEGTGPEFSAALAAAAAGRARLGADLLAAQAAERSVN